ncbi:DUF2318 domain-containing protein [Blautia sp. MSJ-19]|uniref:DUF2318 domain-containing protein n=1 Tax=Blautia sp. MSJ-19 TaxID=2841517 RepID=UPI0020A2003C|nr:DUF2318 domain-containing protein [Blautia sp. MSJ-19]
MKKFMITTAMAVMLMTTATAYGNIKNVMAATSDTKNMEDKKSEKSTAKTTGDKAEKIETKTTDDNKTEKKASKATDDKEDKKETTKIEKGDSLVIKTDDLSEDAAFYPIEVDGTEMEVIAVKDAEGIIRTAFNTCQICYDSGNGYYKQEGDKLVCQNCGNSFTMDQVGETAGGCNPYPILDDDKTVTEDEIQISYDFLKESSDIFANWKRK